MELFFEQLNGGSREGAVALMDERVEMRVHVGENARTLRGLDQVGGWFLRADAGLKMIPGAVQDMGNTYQADLLVVRPGVESQHLDAAFRVEAGKITSINLAPRRCGGRRPGPGGRRVCVSRDGVAGRDRYGALGDGAEVIVPLSVIAGATAGGITS